jgi:hypothetical protein
LIKLVGQFVPSLQQSNSDAKYDDNCLAARKLPDKTKHGWQFFGYQN